MNKIFGKIAGIGFYVSVGLIVSFGITQSKVIGIIAAIAITIMAVSGILYMFTKR